LSPNDNSSFLNNINFSNVGRNISKDSEAFKKIQKFSKVSSNNISLEIINNNSYFNNLNNLYVNQSSVNNNSYSYGSYRQHNFTSANSSTSSFLSLLDQKSFNKFFSFVLNTEKTQANILSKTKPYSTIPNQNSLNNKKILDGNKYVLLLEHKSEEKLGNIFFYK
jgi:hypothetical protein